MSWIEALEKLLSKVPEIEAKHEVHTGFKPTRIWLPMPTIRTPNGTVIAFRTSPNVVSEDRENSILHDDLKL